VDLRWFPDPFIKSAFILCACALAACAGLPAASLGPAQTPQADIQEIQWQIEQALAARPIDAPKGEPDSRVVLREVYGAKAYAPLWNHAGKVAELIALLQDAETYGLNAADYNLTQIGNLQKAGNLDSPVAVAEFDILLSESLLLYASHRRFGKVKAQELDPNFNFRREEFARPAQVQMLLGASGSESLESVIESIAPTGPISRLFLHHLQKYRAIAAEGGWPLIPPGPTLHPGDQDPRLVSLRERLLITGDLTEAVADPSAPFDSVLETAVRHFQGRHALTPDGLVGAGTLAALNVPVETRIDQLRLSLERLRWVSKDAPYEFIAINIAGYELVYFKDRELIWTTRVTVGRSYRQTPVFRGDITYLEINPTWTVPPTILRNDTLPAVRKDPNYLAEKNISVLDRTGHRVDPASIDWGTAGRGFPYTLRQEPGPDNALGRIKFIFPNSHFVYLHDTPHKELFDSPERAFSSGCIRVEHPLELARLVLEGRSEFNMTDIQRMIDSGRTERVVLDESLPILVLYLTASIDDAGNARFFRDVYQRDAAVLSALNAPVGP